MIRFVKSGRVPLLLILAAAAGSFTGNLGVYFVPFQVGALMDGLQVAASTAGMLGSAEVAMMGVTAIVASPRVAAWPFARVAVYGVLIAAGAELLSAFVGSAEWLFPLRMLVGVGCGLTYAATCTAVASTAEPDRNFGWALTIMNCLFLVLFLIAPHAMAFGVQKGLFISLALCLLLTLPCYRFFSSVTVVDADGETPPACREGSHRYLIAAHVFATILLNVGLGALWAFVERICMELGVGPETVGATLSMSMFFMILGAAVAGWLGTRFGRAIPMATAAVLCGIASVTIAHAGSLPVYAAGVFLYNAAFLFIGPYIIVGTSSALDPSGRLAAAMGGIMFISYSAGIGMSGFIAEQTSFAVIGNFALITCLMAAPLFALVNMRLEKGVPIH